VKRQQIRSLEVAASGDINDADHRFLALP